MSPRSFGFRMPFWILPLSLIARNSRPIIRSANGNQRSTNFSSSSASLPALLVPPTSLFSRLIMTSSLSFQYPPRFPRYSSASSGMRHSNPPTSTCSMVCAQAPDLYSSAKARFCFSSSASF